MAKKVPKVQAKYQWVSIHTEPAREVPDVYEIRRYGRKSEMRLRYDNNDAEAEGLARLCFDEADDRNGMLFSASELDWLSQACAVMAAELERRGHYRYR